MKPCTPATLGRHLGKLENQRKPDRKTLGESPTAAVAPSA